MWNLVLTERYSDWVKDVFIPLKAKGFTEVGKEAARAEATTFWLRRRKISDGPEGSRFAKVSNPRLAWIEPLESEDISISSAVSKVVARLSGASELAKPLTRIPPPNERKQAGTHCPDPTAEQ